MIEQTSLDELVRVLGTVPTHKEKKARVKQERKINRAFEWACVGMCDTGEFLTELYYRTEGLGPWEMLFVGAAGGITLGGLYATGHTMVHGFKHRKDKSRKGLWQSCKDLTGYAGEGLKYAITTEGCCVVAATLTEALTGLVGSTTEFIGNDPLSPGNIALRIITLPLTFYVGIRAMSMFTLKNKREAYRWISEKNALPKVHKVLSDLSNRWYLVKDKKSMVIEAGAEMWIHERSVPLFERGRFNNENFSMYSATSKIFPYLPEVKPHVERVMNQSFTEAGLETIKSENVFAHEH